VHSNKYLGCTRSHRCGLGTCAWLYSTLVQPPCMPVAEQLFVLLLKISTYSSTYLCSLHASLKMPATYTHSLSLCATP
jgi:hypothetical protein